MKQKTLGLVHTSATLVPVFGQLCKAKLPGVNVFNIADDSLVKGIIASGSLTPQIARKVMDQFRRLARAEPGDFPRAESTRAPPAEPGPPPRRAPTAERLSDKEEKILELIAEGMMNRQIASALFLAEGTVKNYVSRIMEKLHANTRTELAVRSARQPRNDSK